MTDSSLWPTLAEIQDSVKYSPIKFLRKQGDYLKQISPNLSYVITENVCNFPFTPLSNLPKIQPSLLPQVGGNSGLIDASFKITRINKIYSAEILRLRYDTISNYPVDIYDCCNYQSYRISNIESLAQCLKRIFNSTNCKNQINYIMSDSVG